MAGDPFTSAIFRWLRQVQADRTLPRGSLDLAFAISQHINRRTKKAWPSQATLAATIGVESERTVGRLADALVAGGHLIVRRRKQQSSVYTLAQDRTYLSYLAEDTDTAETGQDSPRPDENVRSCDQDPTLSSPRPDTFVHQDRTYLSGKPSEYNHLRNHEGESRAHATLIPDDFRLDDGTFNWALDRLGSVDAVNRSVERFVNHHRQIDGKQAYSRDWQAKARNWIDDDAAKLAAQPRSLMQAADNLVGMARRGEFVFSERPKGLVIDGTTTEGWRDVLSGYVKYQRWTNHTDLFGPPPTNPACRAPPELLVEFGITIAKETAA